MGKKEFMREVAAGAGVTIAQAEAVINSAAKAAGDALKRDGQVRVPGLVTMVTKDYAARPGRNPKTGDPCEVPAATRIRIKPSATLAADVLAKSSS